MSKASGALGLGISSRKIGDMATARPTFVASLASLAKGGIIPAAGGVIVNRNGEVAGAVGITGHTSDNEDHAAGLEAAE